MKLVSRIVAFTILVVAASAVRAQAGPQDLVEAIQRGGNVIFLRHAATDRSQIDTGRLGDRAGQRNLSPSGIEQAKALGAAFAELDIDFDRILASPVYRARDTAELAFGPDNITVTMDLVADDYAGKELNRMLNATRRLLAEPPSGGNTLLIGHWIPLAMVTGLPLGDEVFPEGAMAVFEPTGPDARFLGILTADELFAAARD